MAKRKRPGKSKSSGRPERRQPFTVQEIGGGMAALTLNTGALPDPPASFYANTANVQSIGTFFSVVFGQLYPGDDSLVQAAVAFEIPPDVMRWLQATFNDAFRKGIEGLRSRHGAMRAFPPLPQPSERPAVPVYPAHLARILLNDNACTLDWYEVSQGFDGFHVNGTMRVRCVPPVAVYLVDRCDELLPPAAAPGGEESSGA